MRQPALSLTLTLAIGQIAQGIDCFFPNSDKATTHAPCPGVTDDSPGICCASFDGWPHIDTCLSNGYCYSIASGKLYRGACTIWNWDTAECPHHCIDVNPQDDATVSPCVDTVTMCCGSITENGTDCCSNEDNMFAWNNGYMLLNSSTIASVQLNASTSASVSASTAPAASISHLTASSTCPPSGMSTISQTTAIGIGVGLGVPLLITSATLAYVFFMWKPKWERTMMEGKFHEKRHLAPTPAPAPSAGWPAPYEVGSPDEYKAPARHEAPNDPVRFEAP